MNQKNIVTDRNAKKNVKQGVPLHKWIASGRNAKDWKHSKGINNAK